MTLIRQLYRWQKPEILVEQLIKTWGEAGLIWLDGDGTDLGRWAILAVDPIDQICCRGLPKTKAASNPFNALKNLKAGHWTGWLSYEAAAWTEPKNPWKSDEIATLWIAAHDPILKFDLKKHELWIEGRNKNRFQKFAHWLENIEESQKIPNQLPSIPPEKSVEIPLDAWEWITHKANFSYNVEQIKNWIAKGDIFQANLTTSCTTILPNKTKAIDIFQKLRKLCPAPFAGLVIGADQANNEAIISTSPERFLKVLPNGEVESRPIKGTRPRHPDPKKDADLAAALVCSAKDRAENIMIVDLIRNDLGRVCKPGSISVPQIVELESYSQVHHLTSVVKGFLQPNKTWVDLLEASWPGGSITGAPKLRACQRLHELEPVARGPYCGSLIHLDWNGTFDSNILIRSLILEGRTLRAHAGCGIVADSDPQNEAEELSWKLIPILKALE